MHLLADILFFLNNILHVTSHLIKTCGVHHWIIIALPDYMR